MKFGRAEERFLFPGLARVGDNTDFGKKGSP